MTTGELITHTNLTLFGHIYLSHLQDARRKFVTNGDSKLLTLHLSIKQLVLLHIVDDELTNEFILMLIICPLAGLDITVLQVLQVCHSELRTLRDNLCTGIVLHTL